MAWIMELLPLTIDTAFTAGCILVAMSFTHLLLSKQTSKISKQLATSSVYRSLYKRER